MRTGPDDRGGRGGGKGGGREGGGRFDEPDLPPQQQRHPWHPHKEAKHDWHYHITPPAEGEGGEITQIAGCSVRVSTPKADWWLALETCQAERVRELLAEGGVEVDKTGGPYESTPLGWAAFAGDAALVATLLESKADPNIAAKKGSSPLHMAVWNGDHAELVELLLKAGAKPEARNGKGQTALDVAKQFDALERNSRVGEAYDIEAWRELRGKAPPGRPRTLALLEEATPAG
eukprot:7386713-Prymnesium_polylepis.1